MSSEYAWLLLAAMFVFLMQAGFLCLETGKIRSKNSIYVAAKNISDFIISTIIFWLFGFAFMFGLSWNGLIGGSSFYFGASNSPFQISFFIFQMMFCGTAATILSGAVAERMSFSGYIYATIVLTSLIYPITGHWAWASFYDSSNAGWLEDIGFVDFAGSTVVHSVGGWVALAAILIVGPRLGRFDDKFSFPVGSNIPMSALGTMLIWLGWYGFNGGSTLLFSADVPIVILNTTLAAVWGGLSSTLIHYYKQRFIDVTLILNGVLSGLVAITASCHAVTPQSASLIGIVAGAILVFGTRFIERHKIDDALGVVPTHLFAGVWGTLAVALFSDLSTLDTGLGRLEQFYIQLLGITTIGVYAFGISFLLLSIINRYRPLRVSRENEIRGMNVTEHRATTELVELLNDMHEQETQGTFTEPVQVEPFTEVGQIATKYNRVIKRVNDEITKRDSAIDSFRSSEKRKGAILNSSMDCIISIDSHGKILEFNQSAERTFGFNKQQVIGKKFVELFIREEDKAAFSTSLLDKFSNPMGLLINKRNSFTLCRDESDEFPAEITITSTNFEKEFTKEYTLIVRDVTHATKLQSKLKLLAYSDPLTGLYNRTYLLQSLRQAVKVQREDGGAVAVFFMDLDKFKKVNDTLGHKAGDELLNEVAKRLTSSTRETDTIARWGGDEFVVMISGHVNHKLAQQKAHDFLHVMREPLLLSGRTIKIPTSIGVAISLDGTDSAEELIQQADIAMYQAKQQGRNNYQFFLPEMAHLVQKQFKLEQEIRQALSAQDQFTLYFQPKLNIQNNVIGFEALIRWQHPIDGLIYPGEFIPVAEESDLIILLDEFVIKQTCMQLRLWQDEGYRCLPISVNISGKHLTSGTLVGFIKEQLDRYNVDGSLLEIEITEGVLVTDLERCIAVMVELKSMDIRLAIDDFGTGYSSLNYLKRLPLDILKIDRSFVDECTSSTEDGQIINTIISLSQNLELESVAEGVETQAQFDFLVSKGCDVFQGYFFYKPLPISEAQTLLDIHK